MQIGFTVSSLSRDVLILSFGMILSFYLVAFSFKEIIRILVSVVTVVIRFVQANSLCMYIICLFNL